ncbi:MAG: hypothetical protein IPM23_03925 [Candidatus Melainabacteria bacterium]|nr:hypothetical protein [Candidatus Melainabacteria bacterium]
MKQVDISRAFEELLARTRREIVSPRGTSSGELVWTRQLCRVLPDDYDEKLYGPAVSTIASALVDAMQSLQASLFYSTNLHNGQIPFAEALVGSCGILTEILSKARVQRQADLALALLVEGDVRDLCAPIFARRHRHIYTSGSDLEIFLGNLDRAISGAVQLVAEPERSRNHLGSGSFRELAHQSVLNARSKLSRFFSKSLSEWNKSLVFCRWGRKFMQSAPVDVARLTQIFDAAETHLSAMDYARSMAHLDILAEELDSGQKR